MKFLGIDYGTKRIGVAISDEEGGFSFPKAIIENNEKTISFLSGIIKNEKVKAIVIGESIASNEEKNSIMELVNKFKAKLVSEFGVPVFFEREDFSSVEASRYQTNKGHKDDSAAAIILQRFLDKRNMRK